MHQPSPDTSAVLNDDDLQEVAVGAATQLDYGDTAPCLRDLLRDLAVRLLLVRAQTRALRHIRIVDGRAPLQASAIESRLEVLRGHVSARLTPSSPTLSRSIRGCTRAGPVPALQCRKRKLPVRRPSLHTPPGSRRATVRTGSDVPRWSTFPRRVEAESARADWQIWNRDPCQVIAPTRKAAAGAPTADLMKKGSQA